MRIPPSIPSLLGVSLSPIGRIVPPLHHLSVFTSPSRNFYSQRRSVPLLHNALPNPNPNPILPPPVHSHLLPEHRRDPPSSPSPTNPNRDRQPRPREAPKPGRSHPPTPRNRYTDRYPEWYYRSKSQVRSPEPRIVRRRQRCDYYYYQHRVRIERERHC